MSQRKPWKDLSPAYRARLERQGINSHNHGVANLIRARGHQPARPVGAAPRELVERIVKGEALPQEIKDLPKAFTRPAWVPKSAAPDVAAALSQLPDPKRWESVEFIPRADDQPWTMVVHLKGNAYDREILIPGGGGPGSGAKEVLEIVTNITKKQEVQEAKKRAAAAAVFFDVLGSDEEEA